MLTLDSVQTPGVGVQVVDFHGKTWGRLVVSVAQM